MEIYCRSFLEIIPYFGYFAPFTGSSAPPDWTAFPNCAIIRMYLKSPQYCYILLTNVVCCDRHPYNTKAL